MPVPMVLHYSDFGKLPMWNWCQRLLNVVNNVKYYMGWSLISFTHRDFSSSSFFNQNSPAKKKWVCMRLCMQHFHCLRHCIDSEQVANMLLNTIFQSRFIQHRSIRRSRVNFFTNVSDKILYIQCIKYKST